MGHPQEQWFYESLSESNERGAAWRVIGNQLIFSRVFENDECKLSADNWNVRGLPPRIKKQKKLESQHSAGLHRKPEQDAEALV